MFLKCAHDVVRGKGDAIGGNIVSLKRFGFSEPRKIGLCFYHGKSGSATHQQLFEEKEKIQICNCMAETMFLKIHCCELL